MVPNLSTSSLCKHHFHLAYMDDTGASRFHFNFTIPILLNPFHQKYSKILQCLVQKSFPESPFKNKKFLFTTLAPQAPTEGLSGIISEPPKMHSVEPTWRTKPTSQAKSAWDELWVVWLLRKAGLALTSLTCFLLAWKIQNKRLACESQRNQGWLWIYEYWIFMDLPSFQWYLSLGP